MSQAKSEQVGSRVRFPAPRSTRKRTELITPTRPKSHVTTIFNTAMKNSSSYDALPSYNPFTPRNDRGAIPAARSHTLSRHNPMAGTVRRPSQYQMLANSRAGLATPSEHRLLGGSGVGAWPKEPVPGSGQLGDSINAIPFARPKSPGPGSPHLANNVLPSFLMGSAQVSKSPAQPGSFASEPGVAAQTGSFFGGLGTSQPTALASSGSTPAPQPTMISPRSTRRLSGFGSNDMLSGAYKSRKDSAKEAAPPEDAPPVIMLDDVDWSGTAQAKIKALARHKDEAPAAKSTGREEPEIAEAPSADGPVTNEQLYDNLTIRSVMVLDLPNNTEYGVYNSFREYGRITSFTVVSQGKTSTLALLYSEPWQAQRVVSLADCEGKLRVGPKRKVRIGWANAECVDHLFMKLYPDRQLPFEDDALSPNSTDEGSLSLTQRLQMQTPRARRAARMASIMNGLEVAPRRLAHMANASVVRQPPPPKPRNGVFQTALDLIFGW